MVDKEIIPIDTWQFKPPSLQASWVEYFGRVHDAFDEHHILIHVVFAVQDREPGKLWTSTCYIHIRRWSFEWGALSRRFERLDDVFPMFLVDEDQTDFVVKWPLQQRIIFSLHQDEKQGQVRLVPCSISIEICSDAHLIAISVNREVITVLCIKL